MSQDLNLRFKITINGKEVYLYVLSENLVRVVKNI